MVFENAIIQALKHIDMPSDITPILADRSGVEPAAPYLLISIISTTNIGLPRKSVSHGLGEAREYLFQVKDINVSFTFHAESKSSTHDWVQHFSNGIFSDSFDWAFSQQGLGIVGANDIIYQPQPVDGKNYKRAILDITFRSEILDDFKVYSLDKVVVDGALNGIEYNFVDAGHTYDDMLTLVDELEELVNINLPQSISNL